MSFKIQRKEKESSQNLISRFLKNVRASRFVLRLRKKRFHKRPKSHQLKKKAALRREELKEKYKNLKKLGKL